MITTLTRLEVEEQAAYDRGLDVQYTAPSDPRLEGEPARAAWMRGRITIYINRRLLEAEKLTLLLHELDETLDFAVGDERSLYSRRFRAAKR